MRPDRSARCLALLLAVAGTAHFVVPAGFDRLVPASLPGGPRAWTWGSGAAELACAAGLLRPRTRRSAAAATAVLFVAVFPGNVKMAVDARDGGILEQVVASGRLPLQVPLVLWAVRVRRQAKGRPLPLGSSR